MSKDLKIWTIFVLLFLTLAIFKCTGEVENIKFVRRTRPIVNNKFNPKPYLAKLQQGNSKISSKGNTNKKDGSKKVGSDLHIINGWQAQRGMIPWQAAVTMDQSSLCGGSLVTTRHVLSAAHCIDNSRNLLVVLGAQNINYREQGRLVLQTRKKVMHPDYNADLLKNDISVIFLPRKVVITNYIDFIRLPVMSDDRLDYTGQVAAVSGWGKTKERNTDMSTTLRYTDVAVVNDTDCISLYGEGSFRDSNVCALGDNRRATCLGDSGGPLVLKDWDGTYTQIGVMSYGSSAGCGKGYPDVYTRTSSFVGWIASQTNKNYKKNARR